MLRENKIVFLSVHLASKVFRMWESSIVVVVVVVVVAAPIIVAKIIGVWGNKSLVSTLWLCSIFYAFQSFIIFMNAIPTFLWPLQPDGYLLLLLLSVVSLNLAVYCNFACCCSFSFWLTHGTHYICSFFVYFWVLITLLGRMKSWRIKRINQEWRMTGRKDVIFLSLVWWKRRKENIRLYLQMYPWYSGLTWAW